MALIFNELRNVPYKNDYLVSLIVFDWNNEKLIDELLDLCRRNDFYYDTLYRLFKLCKKEAMKRFTNIIFTIRHKCSLVGFCLYGLNETAISIDYLLIDKPHRRNKLASLAIINAMILNLNNGNIFDVITETETADALRFFTKHKFKIIGKTEGFLKMKLCII